MSGVSGWCSGPGGGCESPRAHKACEDRCRRGLLTCACARDGGHESPSVEGDSSDATGKIGAEVKTAPGGALTPESQGLADYQGVD